MTDNTQQARAAVTPEAIEAAADALIDSKLGDHPGINGEEFVEAATAALHAAAPHLLRSLVGMLDEWAGRSKSGYYDEAQDDVIEMLRPYRG